MPSRTASDLIRMLRWMQEQIRSTFRFSYNHNDSKGIYLNNNLNKNAFDLRVTHKITDRIDIDISTSYTNLNGKNPPRLGGLDAFGSLDLGHMFTWSSKKL